jgi:hypothetical protein
VPHREVDASGRAGTNGHDIVSANKIRNAKKKKKKKRRTMMSRKMAGTNSVGTAGVWASGCHADRSACHAGAYRRARGQRDVGGQRDMGGRADMCWKNPERSRTGTNEPNVLYNLAGPTAFVSRSMAESSTAQQSLKRKRQLSRKARESVPRESA